MLIPGGEDAIVDIEKLTGYCLNLEHPRGKHKARVFAAALGISVDNVEDLRVALLHAAATADAQRGAADEFGVRYMVDFEIRGPLGPRTVASTWIIRRGDVRPRLTSCFVR